MQRTSVLLPYELKIKATRTAKGMGVSLGEFIRTSLEMCCMNKVTKNSDPFFADNHFYTGDVPKDLAARHDDYLY